LLAAGQGSPANLAVDATSAYWLTEDTPPLVMTVGLSGGTPLELAPTGAGPGMRSQIAVGSKYVFWTVQSGLMKVAK
jgi:hypothetical protein